MLRREFYTYAGSHSFAIDISKYPKERYASVLVKNRATPRSDYDGTVKTVSPFLFSIKFKSPIPFLKPPHCFFTYESF